MDISSFVQDAAAAIVDDSFLRCFQSHSSDPWNWNIYLAPLWLIGLVVRYLILFPLRYASLHPYASFHSYIILTYSAYPWVNAMVPQGRTRGLQYSSCRISAPNVSYAGK